MYQRIKYQHSKVLGKTLLRAYEENIISRNLPSERWLLNKKSFCINTHLKVLQRKENSSGK